CWIAAGRRRQVAREFPEVTFERRTFLLLPGWGQRPTYDEYIRSHRIAAKQASGLPFAIPEVGAPYPKSSLPPALLAMHAQKVAPDRLETLEEELYRSAFERLEDVADPAVLRR